MRTPSSVITARFICMLVVFSGFTGCFAVDTNMKSFGAISLLPIAAQTQHVRFANIGDFGIRGSGEEAVATLLKQWQPEFIVTNGDNNYQRGEAATMDGNIGAYYHDYIFPYKGDYGAGATENRFWPALGDHDWYSLTCTGDACTGPHFDYFTLPGNERYYAIAKGPVHIFILNTNEHEPDGFLYHSPQGEWLRQQLAAATEPWKIVISHHPPYSSGSVHGSINSAQWPYKAWGASAVISGNDHTYERLQVDGLPYFVNGLGGNTPYTFTTPILPESQVRYNAGNGALLIDATDQQMTFQFINTAGAIIDTYTLNRAAAPPNTPAVSDTPAPTATSTPTTTQTPPQLTPPPSLADKYRYVRFVAKTEVHGQLWAALAELDLFDGNANFIPKQGWHTTYADSEEFAKGEGYAPFAIDNDPYTYWHTEYVSRTPGFPHELRIDLGASHTLSAFRYLPRQDSDSGRIAEYEFYVSQDGQQWGTPVAKGSFPNTANAQTVNFGNPLLPNSTPDPSNGTDNPSNGTKLFLPLVDWLTN